MPNEIPPKRSDEHNGRHPRWEPGSLSTHELEQILMDVLTDLWSDSYRRDDSSNRTRYGIFRRKIELALYCATGNDFYLTTNRNERG